MTVTLYSKPSCQPCTATKRHLAKREVEYAERDVYEDPDALILVKELGYLSAPVVVVEEEGEIVQHWGGFRPDQIDKLAA